MNLSGQNSPVKIQRLPGIISIGNASAYLQLDMAFKRQMKYKNLERLKVKC